MRIILCWILGHNFRNKPESVRDNYLMTKCEVCDRCKMIKYTLSTKGQS